MTYRLFLDHWLATRQAMPRRWYKAPRDPVSSPQATVRILRSFASEIDGIKSRTNRKPKVTEYERLPVKKSDS